MSNHRYQDTITLPDDNATADDVRAVVSAAVNRYYGDDGPDPLTRYDVTIHVTPAWEVDPGSPGDIRRCGVKVNFIARTDGP